MATAFDLSTLSETLSAVSASLASTNQQEDEDRRLPALNSTTEALELKIHVLLWNIYGDSSAGMADARRLLVQEVVSKCSPDVLLLQEVEANKSVDYFRERCQPRRRYNYHRSAKHTEAYIVYDSQCFRLVSRIDISGVIGDANLLGATPPVRTRGHTSPDQVYYSDRACAIRVHHHGTGKELVLMSFHNASTRTGGRKANVISYAKGFLTLVCMIHKREGVPVIAGGDFNCDRSDLIAHAHHLQCELPNYTPSERRRTSEKIDLYVIKSSSSVDCHAEVFEALPLADPTSAAAHAHHLGRDRIRYLVDNAPEKKSTGEKLQRHHYTNCTNHDPTLGTVRVH